MKCTYTFSTQMFEKCVSLLGPCHWQVKW